jgi:hypothetical protein
MMCASGTLNGSSPAANLASANIKGKWVVFHFASGRFAAHSLFIALK